MICGYGITGGTAFAECFLCKERGHISKNCPSNKNGIYPKVCKLCQVWFLLFVSVLHGFRVEVSLIIDFSHKNVEII